MDIIVLAVSTPYQFNDSDNYYTNELKTVRTVALITMVAECVIKVIIAAFSFIEFKKYRPNELKFLMNFDYSQEIPTLNRIPHP